ncbi:helix-turn-helix transcriptional regulator [Natronolimnohabitans innermongolicus]|uniref:HTH iclR-type domain-containing protein n=1 Tax=Natronolimnohabitans innermongolicus JCM 12255 TaxID=1227499 RepID=L9X4Q5_9EURY|nr:hypothetical protein [Natronolimnohabitans innermongolicus]ELY56441.1 hypothetical protein C493_10088 [Natronolimnohabitans innermongolicus JCM 12255]
MDAKGRRALLLVLVGIGCLLAVVSVGVAGVAADGSASAAALQDDGEDDVDSLDDADSIEIDAFVHENGSATFVVDYRFENNSDEEWTTLRDDVEDNTDSYVDAEQARWNDVLEEGVNATEREEMEITDLSIETDESHAPREMGHVEVTFEWHSFAYPQLNQLEVDESLAGFSLPRDTSFQLFAPDGYVIDEVSPSPENQDGDSAHWVSEGDPFSSNPPTVLMSEERDEPAEPTESDEESAPSMAWLIVLAALGMLAAAAVAGWWVRKRRGGPSAPDPVSRQGPAPVDDEPNGGDGERPPPELLSNEERVLRLLEDHGGRIKQQEVVSELDWTEAKTSQVVSGLREDDDVEVFRIGRENVLALPDDEDETTEE